MEIADGFMASQQLFAADHVGLFEALADEPMTTAELVEALDVPRHRLVVVLDAMVALDLVRRRDGRYANAPQADAFLTGDGPVDLRPALGYRRRVSFPMWEDFADVASGDPVEPPALDDEETELFSDAMAAITGGMARVVAEAYDWGRHHRVLDVGGGKGHWLHVLLEAHPDLEATLLELPDVADLARHAIPPSLKDRLDVVAGDALEDPIPSGHDVVLAANVLHQFTPDDNRRLLGRIREAVEPGARLLLADTWTEPETGEPEAAATLGGEFLLFTGEGRSYRVTEAREWLGKTGWTFIGYEHLEGPESMVVAEAR